MIANIRACAVTPQRTMAPTIQADSLTDTSSGTELLIFFAELFRWIGTLGLFGLVCWIYFRKSDVEIEYEEMLKQKSEGTDENEMIIHTERSKGKHRRR